MGVGIGLPNQMKMKGGRRLPYPAMSLVIKAGQKGLSLKKESINSDSEHVSIKFFLVG